MGKELEYLTNLSSDFVFQNEELTIHHKQCPVFNLFLGTIIFLQDFREGCLSVYGVQEVASIGVWNDIISDFSYRITRISYGKYYFECCEEDIVGEQQGSICDIKRKFISKDTMQSLTNQLKSTILHLLQENEASKDIVDYLNDHKSWRLVKPVSIAQLQEWQSMNQWHYR